MKQRKKSIRGRRKRRILSGLLAVLLAATLGIGMFMNSGQNAQAAPDTVVDADTTNNWENVISPEGAASTENVGRIWTDKSVFNSDYSFADNSPLHGEVKKEAWMLNGQEVLPKTSEDDSDPDHIQFYTRQRAGQTIKMTALKEAVNDFIDSMGAVNSQIEDSNSQSRIAIVKFADDTYRYTTGNDRGAGGSSNYNYTQVVSDFTADTSELKSDINDLNAGGATAADHGMTLAEDVLLGGTFGSGNNRGTYTGARADAKKIVIFFTDGEPNHNNGFDGSVANDAIEKSGEIKAAGTTVYTIGVFSGANPGDTSENFNAYMHGVSSNYPNAASYTNLGERAPESDYYKAESSSDELSAVFDDIFQSESESVGSGSPIEEVTQQGGYNTPGYLTFTDTLGNYMQVSGKTMSLAYDAGSITIGADGAAPDGSDEVGKATLDSSGDADVYTFNYSVSEITDSLPGGVTYVGGNTNITVTVTDDRHGSLSVDIDYAEDAGGIEFVNAYGAGTEADIM